MLKDLFRPQKRLLAQEAEIRRLRDELDTLKQQNSSMREGMRRCVTCEYRLVVRNKEE